MNMKFINRILLFILIFFLIMFAGIWIFNHVFAWAGVIIMLLGVYVGIKGILILINQFKNNKEK